MFFSSPRPASKSPTPPTSSATESPARGITNVDEQPNNTRRQRGGGRIYETIHFYNNQSRFRALLPNGRFIGALARREDAEAVLEAALQFKLRGVRYQGVDSEGSDKFEAFLVHNGEIQHVGFFDTIEGAALAYDRAARRVIGRKADLNFGECDSLLDAPGSDHRYLSLLCSFSRGSSTRPDGAVGFDGGLFTMKKFIANETRKHSREVSQFRMSGHSVPSHVQTARSNRPSGSRFLQNESDAKLTSTTTSRVPTSVHARVLLLGVEICIQHGRVDEVAAGMSSLLKVLHLAQSPTDNSVYVRVVDTLVRGALLVWTTASSSTSSSSSSGDMNHSNTQKGLKDSSSSPWLTEELKRAVNQYGVRVEYIIDDDEPLAFGELRAPGDSVCCACCDDVVSLREFVLHHGCNDLRETPERLVRFVRTNITVEECLDAVNNDDRIDGPKSDNAPSTISNGNIKCNNGQIVKEASAESSSDESEDDQMGIGATDLNNQWKMSPNVIGNAMHNQRSMHGPWNASLSEKDTTSQRTLIRFLRTLGHLVATAMDRGRTDGRTEGGGGASGEQRAAKKRRGGADGMNTEVHNVEPKEGHSEKQENQLNGFESSEDEDEEQEEQDEQEQEVIKIDSTHAKNERAAGSDEASSDDDDEDEEGADKQDEIKCISKTHSGSAFELSQTEESISSRKRKGAQTRWSKARMGPELAQLERASRDIDNEMLKAYVRLGDMDHAITHATDSLSQGHYINDPSSRFLVGRMYFYHALTLWSKQPKGTRPHTNSIAAFHEAKRHLGGTLKVMPDHQLALVYLARVERQLFVATINQFAKTDVMSQLLCADVVSSSSENAAMRRGTTMRGKHGPAWEALRSRAVAMYERTKGLLCLGVACEAACNFDWPVASAPGIFANVTRLLVLEPAHPGSFQLTRLMTNVAKLLVQDWVRSATSTSPAESRKRRRGRAISGHVNVSQEEEEGSSIVVRTCLTVLNVALEQIAWLEPGASPRLLDVASDCNAQWQHPQKQVARQLWMVAAGALAVVLRYDSSANGRNLCKNQMLSGLQVFDRSDRHTPAGKARTKIIKKLKPMTAVASSISAVPANAVSGVASNEDSDDTKPIAVLMREMRAKAKSKVGPSVRVHVQHMSTQVQEYIATVGFVAAAAEMDSNAAFCLGDVQAVVDECHRRHAHKYLKLFIASAATRIR